MMKKIIALLLVLSTTLLFGCNIQFVDPNASADGSAGGSVIVKPDSGTTGGNTSGGSTTTPDSGTTGGNTSGGSTTTPDSGTTGGNTSGGSTTASDSGTTGGNTSGGSTTVPDSGTTGGNTSDGSTTTPDGGTTGGNTSGDSGTTTVPDDKPVTPPEPTSSADITFVYTKLEAAFAAFSARSSYQTTMSGQTVAGGFTQNINSTVNYANDIWKSYYESITDKNNLVKLYHHVYVKGNTTVYSEEKSGSGKKSATITDYRKNFGVAPCDYQLGGYVVDLTTITSASYQKDANGKVTFVVSVDGNKSTDMLVQMVKFGGLAATPTFSKLTFTVICENGTDISSYDTYAEYKIKKKVGFTLNMNATMNLTTTVSDYSETLTFPSV